MRKAFGLDASAARIFSTRSFPETVAAFDSSRAIEDATKIARWFYFLMLSLSAICCLLVATTSDLRLILNSSAIPVTRLGNVLPMTGFYLGGPLLLFIAYVRFHFLLVASVGRHGGTCPPCSWMVKRWKKTVRGT